MIRNIFFKRLIRSLLVVVLGLISFTSYGQPETDTTKALNLYRPPQQLVKDTMDARWKFVQDSILARQQFVRDSL
ncbi:MAG TPA: hypothetical protein VIH57_22615, partial [Bacteroidales bacterium]